MRPNGSRVLVFGTYDEEIDGKALAAPHYTFMLYSPRKPYPQAGKKKLFTYFAEQGCGG